jgi:hypothetical protein
MEIGAPCSWFLGSVLAFLSVIPLRESASPLPDDSNKTRTKVRFICALSRLIHFFCARNLSGFFYLGWKCTPPIFAFHSPKSAHLRCFWGQPTRSANLSRAPLNVPKSFTSPAIIPPSTTYPNLALPIPWCIN